MNADRRTILKLSLGSLVTLTLPAWPAAVRAQESIGPQRDKLRVLDAGGSNVLVCATDEGLVLVDSGAPAFAPRLMEQLTALDNGAVHSLFNTHWHLEQCGANAFIGESGAAILAHQKTWHRLSTRYYLPHEERYSEPLPEEARPSVMFSSKGRLEVGGETIDYGPLVQAHTDGDIYVHFHNANVMAVGGAVSPPELDPELDWYGGGWIGGRAQSLDTLVALADDETLIVPAAGRSMSKAELVAERDMTHALYERLNTLIRSGCGAACMQEEGALEGLGRSWQDPQRFLYAAYKGLWAHHYNLAPDIL